MPSWSGRLRSCGVRRQAVVAEVAPAPPRGVLAGARQVERRVRDRLLQQVHGLLLRVGGCQVGGAGRVGGLRPAVLAPPARERGEDLVGVAAAVADPSRPDGVRRPGGDQLDPLAHGLVPATAVRRGLGGHVHPAAVGHARHDVARVAVADRQRDALGQGQHVGREPGPSRRTGAGPDGRIDHEQRRRGAVLERCEERRVVAHAEVAPEPHHRGGRRGHALQRSREVTTTTCTRPRATRPRRSRVPKGKPATARRRKGSVTSWT